ncbi:MAG: peptidylprolyl isomerase, partial [Bacteroidales bacterium]
MKHYLLILLAFLVFQIGSSQENTRTLIKIDDREISKDEFLRIYNKNKNITEDNQKSVDEYLDMFINYKLKVIEAENRGYDTMSSFIKEMNNYTIQLTDSYFNDDKIIDSLVVKAYERSLEEIKGRHLLLNISYKSPPKDTAVMYDSIMKIRHMIVSGKTFDEVLDEVSPDPRKKIGGKLGWFSAFRMVYPFEVAAYSLPVGEVSMPIRTKYGYHLFIVDGRRKNMGDIEAAHIMTLVRRNATDLEKEAARKKIEKAYAELTRGVSWDSVVVKYSEHKASARRKGYIGWLNSSNSPESILDTCFALDSGDYSRPFLSPYGYHIMKSMDHKLVPSFEEVKEDYERKLRSDSYIKMVMKNQVLDNIKNEYGFTSYKENIDSLFTLIDSSVYDKKWDPAVAKDLTKPVIVIGDKEFTQYDLAEYLSEKQSRIRKRSLNQWFYEQVTDFTENTLKDYERSRIPEKNPDLKHLLEEYHDGILLFNLTEDEVWQKAIEDTAGLEKYYNELPEKYSWDERIAITKYVYSDSSMITPLLKLARLKTKKKLTRQQISSKICDESHPECVEIREMKYEKGDNAITDSIDWKKGS